MPVLQSIEILKEVKLRGCLQNHKYTVCFGCFIEVPPTSATDLVSKVIKIRHFIRVRIEFCFSFSNHFNGISSVDLLPFISVSNAFLSFQSIFEQITALMRKKCRPVIEIPVTIVAVHENRR